MPSRLDDVARALTEPISRRRALRLAATAVAGAYLGVRPGRADAACPSCPRMSDPPEYSQRCSVATRLGCIFVCCPQTYACCTTATGVVCCREGYTCGPVDSRGYPSCKCKNDCGGSCCKDDERCSDLERGLCCKIPCGPGCCQSGEKCVDPKSGTCCKTDEKACQTRSGSALCCASDEHCCVGTLGATCCGEGRVCEKNGGCSCKPGFPQKCGRTCCRRGEKCCINNSTAEGFCGPKSGECCGDTFAFRDEECCANRYPFDPATQQCCGVSGICPKNADCCPDGCCPSGSSCCAHGCCDAAGARVSARRSFARSPRRRRLKRQRRRGHRRAHRSRGSR